MRKKLLLSGLCLGGSLILAMSIQASVWRVNSFPGTAADYTSVQAAHDAATTLNGDTLYIEGSPSGSGALNCSKSLVIIGTGYFLGENPETQASLLGSFINSINFLGGSQGSKIMGCSTGTITFFTSNISVIRCYVSGGNNQVIRTNTNYISNIVITQCYIVTAYTSYNALHIGHITSNLLFSNNYVYGTLNTTNEFSGIFTNNVIQGSINVYNSVIKNNIQTTGSFNVNNCQYMYNIGHSTQFGTANGNQSNVDMNTVFTGSTANSTDGQWQLKSGSPALGAGENGVDCGMYAGAFPYVLSGMPNIPAIYYFNAPPIPTNVIDVAIKAKSHN